MKYLQFIKETFQELTAIPSPTGYTKQVAEYVKHLLEEMGYAPVITPKGNVEVVLGGEGNPLLLSGHMDTLGAMVRSIKENGRIRPTTLNGHRWETADGENCMIMTRDGKMYTGVVLNHEPSVHVADEEIKRIEKNMEILLDENVFTKEETRALGIEVGDYIAMEPRTVFTESGYIKSRFLDDKIGVSILLAFAKYLKEEQIALSRKVSIQFAVLEEVGWGGSAIPADTVEMLCVDMGCVGADLSCTEREVSICAKDSRGPYNYDVVGGLIAAAKEAGVSYAVDVYPHYGSDGVTAIVGGHDIKHGLIGPGVYASHNYERSHMDGVKNTFSLLKAYVIK